MFRIPDFPIKSVLAFGVAVAMLGSLGTADAKSKETVLYYFCHQGNCASGEYPVADLIADKKGNLYGTASEGGANYGGTVFELGKDGVETTLYSFCAQDLCPDGEVPVAGLIVDGSGNFFGTTQNGGQYNFGTVFELSADGAETVLHSFCGGNGCTDGTFPLSGLTSDADGNLYGTTEDGGTAGDGVVFKIASDGMETVLHSFTRGSDGAFPHARLLIDRKSNLYGTTAAGGSADAGTIFKLAPDGTETVLYAFEGGMDASSPVAGLLSDKKGNLSGTSQFGGSLGAGTVFRLARNGTESVIYSFTGGDDGAGPVADLIADKKGNLYGTTEGGGGSGCGGGGCGTVFTLSSKAVETVLHAFKGGGNDGNYPEAGLVADKSGNLYGSTRLGGAGGGGVIFKITP